MGRIQISKSATVLEFRHLVVGQHLACFCPRLQDEDSRRTELLLDEEVWDEMGSPKIVTVTIEPGDRLNLPGVPTKPGEGRGQR